MGSDGGAMRRSSGHWLRAAGVALLGALALTSPAGALVIRTDDGSLAPGCGLVAHLSDPGAHPRPAFRTPLPHSYVSASGRFRVHYTTDPSDRAAVPPADENGDDIPDWVELVAHIADSVVGAYEGLGYTVNLNDWGSGGGTEYDIYLTDLSSSRVYGYTWASDPHMQIDNDYADTIYQTRGAAGLRVTLAHELFHAIQFNYWSGDDAIWWQEMTATFMEDVLYPDINDYVQYLVPGAGFVNTFFEDPSVPLYDDAPGDAHVYGAAVFCHFLDQSAPRRGQGAIRYSFERQRDLRSGDRAVIIQAIETKMGEPIRDLLATFWVWSYFSGSRTRPGLFFRDAAKYTRPPPSKIGLDEDTWVFEGLSVKKTAAGTSEAEGLGASIFRFVPDGSAGGVRFTFSASGPSADGWEWLAAAANRDTVWLYRARDGEIIVDNWDLATDLILVAANGSLVNGIEQYSYVATYDRELTRPAPEPLALVLYQNRPNPFNTITVIPFSLTASAKLSAVLYDVTGRPVRTLLSADPYAEGEHAIQWDGLTDDGRRAGSGIYVLHLTADEVARSQRMVLVR